MTTKKNLLIIFVLLFAFVASGCGIRVKPKVGEDYNPLDGGVYISIDKGETWVQKSDIPTVTGAPLSIGGFMTNVFKADPSDQNALYIGGIVSGIAYTYNQGIEWNLLQNLPVAMIHDIAIDPKSKCTLYVVSENKLLKSTDCGRSWIETYKERDPSIWVTAVAVDHHNPNNVFIGTNMSNVLKSIDGGANWKTVESVQRPVKDIIIDPNDSRNIFVALDWGGLFRSKDNGETWENLWPNMDELTLAGYQKTYMPKGHKGLMFHASGYNLYKSEDYGDTWETIRLVVKDAGSIINDLVVNDNNTQEIYYITDVTFYRSVDGGTTWSTKTIPTQATPKKIIMDPNNNILYVAMYKMPPPE